MASGDGPLAVVAGAEVMSEHPLMMDRFRAQAEAECRRRYHDTGDPGFASEQAIATTEHCLRMREYSALIEPLVKALARMLPVGGRSMIVAPGRIEFTEDWSPEQLQTRSLLERHIAFHRGQCGLGPEVELPPLSELMDICPDQGAVMTERMSDECLAELADGWEHQATTLIHDCSLAGSQYAETCRNTAAALRELQRLRAGLRQIQSIADECVDRTTESTPPTAADREA